MLLSGSGLIVPLLPAPASATPAKVAALIADLVGEGDMHDGRVKLDIPVMVENGNSVGMTVTMDAPVVDVRSIDVFAEGNPLPHVLRVTFGPHAGAPRFATRIPVGDITDSDRGGEAGRWQLLARQCRFAGHARCMRRQHELRAPWSVC
jgi:sulfur-oxidizing protein SoxY